MIYMNTKEQRMFRGDTFVLPVKIVIGNNMSNTSYEIKDTDELFFAIMEPNCPWETAIVRKKYIGSSFKLIPQVTLNPDDTMYLLPGTYYYQLKLRMTTGEVVTLNPKTNFIIQE